MTRRRLVVDTFAVASVAVAFRLLPLWWSPLPFNPDGFNHVRIAESVLGTGSYPASMATDTVGFASLLAASGVATGQPPLLFVQVLSAMLGAATAVLALFIGRRMAADRNWSPGQVRLSGLSAGLLLAGSGVYLYRSMAADEQTLGLLLVPLLAIAVHRAIVTRHPTWIASACLSLLVLPPTHNLSSLVGALVATVLVVLLATGAYETTDGPALGVLPAVGSIAILWTYTVGYHLAVASFTAAEIVQTERLTEAPGVFLAWALFVVIGVNWYVRTTQRLQRGLVFGIATTGFGLFALNAVITIYPGTTGTPTPLLIAFAPLVVPTLLACYAMPWCTDGRSTDGPVLVALIAGALVLAGTSLTAGLTFEYITMLYRAQLFIHLPVFVLASLGALKLTATRRSEIQTVTVTAVFLCGVIATPVVLSGLGPLTFKGVTTPAEFESTAFASESVPGSWTTDDHLRRVAGYHGGSPSIGPVREWLSAGGQPPACPTLGQQSWTTTGAQFYPRPPPRISPQRFQNWTATGNVVYATTSADPLYVVVPPQSPPEATCRP